jgi:hypothetical protein
MTTAAIAEGARADQGLSSPMDRIHMTASDVEVFRGISFIVGGGGHSG